MTWVDDDTSTLFQRACFFAHRKSFQNLPPHGFTTHDSAPETMRWETTAPFLHDYVLQDAYASVLMGSHVV